ncbi:MAG: tRNA (N(6)-L-threonylcarbamoyladenosine(37)-C(2))-methylthiotransferase MtaB [Candidatus Eisenbacteria bacterium]
MRRASVHTLGCRLNQAESAQLADGLRRRGYDLVPEDEGADLYVVNTCSVTRGSEAKCRRLIRFLKRRSPEARVVVTGCYAELEAERIREIDGVDLVVGTANKHRVPDLVEDLPAGGEGTVLRGPIGREVFTIAETGRFRETRANLKIQDGCDVFCTFCVIPFTRGRARSRALGDSLREARELAGRGHREIVLSGVNIGTYEEGGVDFTGLVERIEGVPGIDRVRISSIEPMTVGDRLVDRMAESETLCPYVHLCLQSGDDRILEAMGRPYTAAGYALLFERFTEKVPNIGIGTDVLVGFPGEDDASFRRTYDLLESLPFYHFHVFVYSEHPRTRSARIPDKVRPDLAKERSEAARRLGAEKKRIFHERHVGRTVEVLFEARDRGGRWTGHAPNYLKVSVRADEDLENRIGLVEIERAEAEEARGRLSEVVS